MSKTKLILLLSLVLILVSTPFLAACTKEVVKEVIKEVPVEIIVEKEVIKEVPVIKEVVKEVIKEVPVEIIVEKEVIKEVTVEKIVEKIVEKEVKVLPPHNDLGIPLPIEGVEMPRFYSVGIGSGTGGVGDRVGKAVIQNLVTAFPDMKTRQIPGSVRETPGMLRKGEIDLAYSNSRYGFDGYVGSDEQAGYKNMRYIAFVPGTWSMIAIVLKDSPINDPSELGDKKIGVGPNAAFSPRGAAAILSAYDITFESIEKNGGLIHYGAYDEISDLIISGGLDAMILAQGHPMPGLLRIATMKGVKFLPLNDAAFKALEDTGVPTAPYYLAPGVYDGVTEPWESRGGAQQWFVSKDVPDDVIFNILAGIYSDAGKGMLEAQGDKALAPYTATPYGDLRVPVHPGASKFWEALATVRAGM